MISDETRADPSTLTFLHLQVQQVHAGPSVLLRVVTSNAGSLGDGVLNIAFEPLLSEPFEGCFEGRTSRMLVDD